MSKAMKVQRFEIYGNKVTMGYIVRITLTKINKTQYECGDGWTWTRRGVTYLRGDGKEHGFLVLTDVDTDDEEDQI